VSWGKGVEIGVVGCGDVDVRGLVGPVSDCEVSVCHCVLLSIASLVTVLSPSHILRFVVSITRLQRSMRSWDLKSSPPRVSLSWHVWFMILSSMFQMEIKSRFVLDISKYILKVIDGK
jgi:hypothetical protein